MYVGAGSNARFAFYDGKNNLTYYNAMIVKAVPLVDVKIGNVVVNASTPVANLLFSPYMKVGDMLVPVNNYSLDVGLLGSAAMGNKIGFNYTVYVGGNIKRGGSVLSNSVSDNISINGIPIAEQSKIVFEATGNANYTSVDPTVYYTTANANLAISTSTTLTSDLVCGSLTINTGVTLTTDGFDILCQNTFTNDGTIDTGNPGNGGTGGGGSGTGYSNSYAGSGGGGACGNSKGGTCSSTGAGSGSTPSAPTISISQIQTWYSNGFSSYDSGGGGGADSSGNAGGSGSYGIYIQANSFATTGTINAAGIAGTSTGSCTGGSGGNGGSTLASGGSGGSGGHGGCTTDGSGGGGGGWVLLEYGTGTAPTTGSVSVSGGAGGSASNNGGAGGNGQISKSSYGSTPPITVEPKPTPPSTPSLTLSNVLIDQGQSILFKASFSNGVPPYTYNFQIVNSITDTTIANMLVSNSYTSNTFLWTPAPNLYTSNTFSANVIVTDSEPASSNSVYNAIGYNGLLEVTAVTPSAPTIDSGQSVTLTGTLSGGTSPFSYQWYTNYGSSADCTGSDGNSISGATSASYAASPASSNTYCIKATDSATTAESNTATDTVTVSPAFATPGLSTSNTLLDSGQYFTLTATANGGTAPYTYSFYNVTSSTTALSGCSTNTCTLKTSSLTQGNAFSYNVLVQDSAYNPQTLNSVHESITVNAVPTISLVLSNTLLDAGQYIIFTATGSEGTGRQNVQLFNVSNSFRQNGQVNALLLTIGGSNTFTLHSGASGTFSWAVNSYDEGTTTPYTLNSISESATVAAAMTTPSITTPTPSIQGTGNTLTWKTSFSGGTSSYTYNWNVYNTITGAILANMLETNSFTGNSFSWTIPSSDIGNTVYANVIVTDSATTHVTVNSVESGTITIVLSYTPPSTPTLTLSNTLIDQGQSILFTASTSGGTSSYTYNFQVYNTITNTLLANQLGTSPSFSWDVPAADSGNTVNAIVIITDSATTNEIANSVNTIKLTINTALATPTISPSAATTYDNGQSVTIATYETGGTAPYTYNFLVFNSITNALIANQLGTSNTFTFTANTFMVGNTFKANVLVTDNLQTAANSVNSGTLSFNPTMTTPSITTPSPLTQGTGNTIIWTTSFSGGSSSYTYNWNVYNSITGTILANMLESNSFAGNSFSWVIPAVDVGNTVYANVIITDSATTPVTINSVLSGTITIVPAYIPPSTPTLTLSNTLIDQGQSILFTASFSSGTPPYTYNFQIVNSITDATIANMLVSNSYTSNTFLWTPSPNLYTSNTFKANVVIKDSNPTTVNSVYNAIGYNALLEVTSISPSSPTIDSGQSVTLTATASGGTSPLSYQWYANYGSSVDCTGSNGNSISGATSASYSASPTTTNSYCLKASDSATTATTNTLTDKVTVSSAFTAPTLSNSNVLLDSGEYDTLTATPHGGTAPYTYTWQNVTKNSFTPISGSSGCTSGSSTCTFKTASVTNSNTFSYNVVVTDSAYLPQTLNSINSIITVNTALSASISPASNSIGVSQSQTWIGDAIGGTPPFTYNWLVFNSAGSQIAEQLYTSNSYPSNSYIYTFGTAGTYYANVIITDNAVFAPETVNSLKSTITVSNTCTFTVSNTAITFGGINPGNSVSTQNAILITNTGAVASNVFISGSAWTYGTNSFGASNTAWDWKSGTSYATANRLSSTQTDTLYSLGGGSSKDIFFGVHVPSGEPIGTYSQTEDITSSC